MRVSILGVGALGTVLAACLATSEHEIHLHVRGERGARAMLEGLRVSGVKTAAFPSDRFLFSCDELDLDPELLHGSDVVVFACKAQAVHDLLDFARRLLKPGGIALAVSNGLGHHEALARALGPENVLAATTTHGAYREPDGGVVWAGEGRFNLAASSLGPASQRRQAVLTMLDQAGLVPVWHEDALAMVWEKVLLNLAINPIAALAGLENGELLESDRFSSCMMVYREAAAVAGLERIAIPDEPAFEHQLRQVLHATADNTCSMLQDLKAGRVTEIESLNQAVVNLAEHHGLSVPINQLLVTLIRACHP